MAESAESETASRVILKTTEAAAAVTLSGSEAVVIEQQSEQAKISPLSGHGASSSSVDGATCWQWLLFGLLLFSLLLFGLLRLIFESFAARDSPGSVPPVNMQ